MQAKHSERQAVYIVSADAKDLYLTNYSNQNCAGYNIRYSRGENKGEINTRRFVNTLDYSLDLIKLREIYEKVYRRVDFTFEKRGKEYCRRVINVTFKYSVKEFNRFNDQTYIRFGFLPEEIEIKDGVCIKNGALAGIRLGEPIETPVSNDLLSPYFCYEDGMYTLKKSIKSVLSVADLRNKLYKDGFVCDGIHFRRFKRSSGSSRVGKCLFIDDRLYDRIHKWELCGLTIKEGQEVDLAAFESYIALTLSSIEGIIPIRPENFLVIDDYTSIFQDRVVATSVGTDGWLYSEERIAEIQNSIWDGQSLIDRSLMGEYDKYAMILLRNRFFKSACFNCNLQSFFADNGVTSVEQLNGFTLAERIEDVKFVTTPSSIKYLKFGSLEKWLSMLQNDCDFGVVKHEKPTHFFNGRMVQVHYQLLNTLQMTQKEVDLLIQPSLDYLEQIQNDPAVLRFHIKYGGIGNEASPASTSNDIVYQMLGVNDLFAKTKLYRNFCDDIVAAFKKNLRRGHVLVNGNYSTLFGNPIEMLRSAIGKFDGASQIGIGNIYSSRFLPNQTILGSRSPHVTMGNVWLSKNRDNEEICRYFNLTDEIVCINSIGENLLMRLSGADFDSDTALLTDNPILIEAAQRNYDNFGVPTSMVEAKKVVRHYTNAEQSDLDIKTSVNKIGEIVNLSQELNTKLWDALNNGRSMEDVSELYCDIAKLDVMSGIEIDKAKREFAVDNVAEIARIRKKYTLSDEAGRKIKPNFFGKIAKMKGYYDSEKKNYKFHCTTMDYLQHSINRFRKKSRGENCMPFSEILRPKREFDMRHSVSHRQVERIIGLVREMGRQIKMLNTASSMDEGTALSGKERAERIADIRKIYSDYIKQIKLNQDTAYRLLLSIEEPKNRDISRKLFYMLFSLPNQDFLDLVEKSKMPIPILEETDAGSLLIYQFRYRKVVVVPDDCEV